MMKIHTFGRLAVMVAVLLYGLVEADPLAAQTLTDTVEITIEPPQSTVTLGDSLDLVVTATNTGSEATPPLVVHIDITDPAKATSVDPEDWTPTLSKPIGALDPGQTATLDWRLQPISSGTFATYAVALAPGVDHIASSNVLDVQVDHERTLNPGGILPVAIAAPATVGALLLVQLRLARRTRSRTGPARALPQP